MPIVSYSIKQLNKLLVEEYPMEVIVESLKQLGCDVEDTAEITLYRCPACETNFSEKKIAALQGAPQPTDGISSQ